MSATAEGVPHNLEAEQAIIGGLMWAPGYLEDVAGLQAQHFYDPVHGRLFAEVIRRIRAGETADGVALKRWADADAGMKQIGASRYLTQAIECGAATALQARTYADQVMSLARRREVIVAAQAAIAEAQADEEGDALTRLEARLQEIASGDTDRDAWVSLNSVSSDATERAELGETKGLSTGFPGLDAVTGGLQPGTLWVVGGATSMGKSALGAALSRNIAASGHGVGEVHLEMDATQIGLRAATALAFDPDPKLAWDTPHYLSALRGDLRPEQWKHLRDGAKDTARLPIYVDARPGRSLLQIESAARRLFRKMERQGISPGALVIDHEGLIAPNQGDRYPSLLERASARGEGLLAIGKRLGVGVIALAQLTNEGARADGESDMPSVTQIKYGGALTQAASVVILLSRKGYYAERKPESLRSDEDWRALKSREAKLIVDKSRSGRRATINILMDMPTAAAWEAAA